MRFNIFVQRVMPDCFFVLARFFLRVDGVLLRIYDARYYHSFDSKVVVRERSTREADFLALENRIPVHILRDPEQVVHHLPVTHTVVENIELSFGKDCHV